MNSRQNQNYLLPIHCPHPLWKNELAPGAKKVGDQSFTLTSLPHHYRQQPQAGQGQAGPAHTQLGTCTCRDRRHSEPGLACPALAAVGQRASPGLRVHLDHPVPVALPVPVFV